MFFVGLEETGLADQASREVAFRIDADIEDVLSFVALDEALGSHRPFDFMDVLGKFLGRVRFLRFCFFWLFCEFREGD